MLSLEVRVNVEVLPAVTVTLPVPTASSSLYNVAVYVPGLTPLIENELLDVVPQYCAAVLFSATTAVKPDEMPETVPLTVPRPDDATYPVKPRLSKKDMSRLDDGAEPDVKTSA